MAGMMALIGHCTYLTCLDDYKHVSVAFECTKVMRLAWPNDYYSLSSQILSDMSASNNNILPCVSCRFREANAYQVGKK